MGAADGEASIMKGELLKVEQYKMSGPTHTLKQTHVNSKIYLIF